MRRDGEVCERRWKKETNDHSLGTFQQEAVLPENFYLYHSRHRVETHLQQRSRRCHERCWKLRRASQTFAEISVLSSKRWLKWHIPAACLYASVSA